MLLRWLTIGTDMASRASQRAQEAARDHMAQLASGRRMATAGDDPAGTALVAELQARGRSVAQAQRNIRDGLSVLARADGGLSSIAEILVRMRELAVAAASDSVTDTERTHVQNEADQLLREIEHTAVTTRWSGRTLISRVHADVAFLLDTSGSMAGEIDAVRAALDSFRETFADHGVDVALGLASVGTDTGDDLRRLVDIGAPGFETALSGLPLNGWSQDPYSAYLEAAGVTHTPGVYEPDALSLRARATHHIVHLTDAGREHDVVPDGIPDDEAGVGAALAREEVAVHVVCPNVHRGVFDVVTAATGGTLHSTGDSQGSGVAAALASIAQSIAGGEEQQEPLDLQVGSDVSDVLTVHGPTDATPIGLGLDTLDLSTRDGARAALDLLDGAIQRLSTFRAMTGADIRRLESALAREADEAFAVTATRSRIEDADVAETLGAVTRDRVLAEAGFAALGRVHDINRMLATQLMGD